MRMPYFTAFGPSHDRLVGVTLHLNGNETNLTIVQATALAQELLRAIGDVADSNASTVKRMLCNSYQD